jgi:import inner membrane translocase subunit TIM23
MSCGQTLFAPSLLLLLPGAGGGAYKYGTSLSPYDIDPRYLPQTPEFIFPIERQSRSLSAKMFDSVGTAYISGLSIGGVWGLVEGVRSLDGKTGRLRVNSIVNGCTRRGPFLGNSLGVLALMYSSLEHALCKATNKEDHVTVKMSAATLTGVLFKSTAGIRSMAIAAALGAGLSGAYFAGGYLISRDRTFLFGRKSNSSSY